MFPDYANLSVVKPIWYCDGMMKPNTRLNMLNFDIGAPVQTVNLAVRLNRVKRYYGMKLDVCEMRNPRRKMWVDMEYDSHLQLAVIRVFGVLIDSMRLQQGHPIQIPFECEVS